MSEQASDALPLTGIRVVEFSHMVMGPSCGLVLADLGADVVKIEPPGKGDNTRRLTGSGAGFFPAFNRNRRSLALDLKSLKGIALARRLVAHSDVLIENFRPGGLEALGLGYDALKQDNPRLIYCAMKGFLAGPYESRAALDEVVQMMGGLAYMTGPPGRPLRAGTSINDIMGGMFGVIGILAAIHERARTGQGQLVRSALFENNVLLVAQHMMQFAVTGKAAAPMPARLSAWAVYDVFETGDGSHVFVGVVTDTQWRVFCEAFALTQYVDDPALASNPQRVGARERFMPVIREMFARRTRAEIIGICERVGLPFAPIMRPEDLIDDPQLQMPGAMIEVTLANGRAASTPALPLELKGRRLGLRLDIPEVGAHSRVIAAELGLAPDAIEQLVAEGVLGVDTSDNSDDPCDLAGKADGG